MKLNKTIIISDIISILTAFALFVWIFIEMKCVAIVYDRILNNLFIKDFNPVQKIILSRSSCQENGMYPLINYTFPGIPESCYNSKNKTVSEGACKDKKKADFQIIQPISKKNFTIWRNKIMCAKYFEKDKSSYKLIDYKYDQEENCGEGYKKCGHINKEIAAEDKNLHKILCIKSNNSKEEECPLNFITITNDTSPYENTTEEYNISSFENGYYLITSNKKIDDSIITKITISEGELPCYEKGKYSNTTSQFPTINEGYNFNCSTKKIDEENQEDEIRNLNQLYEEDENDLINNGYDIRFKRFDMNYKYNVLIDNDIDYSYSQLPNLTNWEQDMYKSNFSLFYQDSFIIKEECNNFDFFENTIIKLKKIQSYRVIIALAHILIYVLLFSILGLIKVILAWRHSLLFGIKVCLSFIIFGINFRFIYSSKQYIKNLETYNSNLAVCLDSVALKILKNHDIKEIIDELKGLYNYEEKVWYIYIFFNFIEACRLVHKIYIRCKNTYRRNIANREIGSENLKNIFETVRNKLAKPDEAKEE